jgi:hypothetical protein
VKLTALGVVVRVAPIEVSLPSIDKDECERLTRLPDPRAYVLWSHAIVGDDDVATKYLRIDVENPTGDHEAHPKIVWILCRAKGDAALLHLAADQLLAAPCRDRERQLDEERRFAFARSPGKRVQTSFAHQACDGVGDRTELVDELGQRAEVGPWALDLIPDGRRVPVVIAIEPRRSRRAHRPRQRMSGLQFGQFSLALSLGVLSCDLGQFHHGGQVLRVGRDGLGTGLKLGLKEGDQFVSPILRNARVRGMLTRDQIGVLRFGCSCRFSFPGVVCSLRLVLSVGCGSWPRSRRWRNIVSSSVWIVVVPMALRFRRRRAFHLR